MIYSCSFAWAISVEAQDGSHCLVGPLMFGLKAQPHKTALFSTRREARSVLAAWKRASAWAFKGAWASGLGGGNRIYRGARIIRVCVDISEAA